MRTRHHALLAMITFLLMAVGCASTNVVTKYDCNTVANNPVNQKTSWSFAWGLIQPKDIDPHCENSFNHLNRVTTKTNMGYILLSFVTLGIVIPQKVEWCCAPPQPGTGTLGTPKK